ncbi:RecQ family ATP-dependent DNA helicase [Patescibacteria group bacterium]
MEIPENKKQQTRELLKLHYGYDSFWPGQEKTIDNILANKSTVVIMPTGGGKSLCYQLPALVLDGVTIVISPLIALMKDQVDNLTRIGIPATFINSSITFSETINRLEAVKKNQYKLLYIAPERFYNQEFKDALKDMQVSLFAIDEAHCISQWGHDFRPSYLKLCEAIELVGNPPVMALTATATPEVREDIIKQLDLQNPELVITGFARPNLQFGVIHANERNKPSYILDAINSVRDESGIIYVGTRARADDLLQILLENDIEAVSYHAGMETEERKWIQENFMKGKAKVIVATNAFGLGIDKANIRYVIHYDMPGTVEAYYQEAGRAGRDGSPSFCMLLYNSRDRHLQEFFIKGDNPPPETIREIYETLLGFESEVVLITYAELGAMLSDTLPDMAIGTSLKILEREGYIGRSHEKRGQAYLKLIKDINYIKDTFNSRAQKQRKLFDRMSDKFQNEMAKGWEINIGEIAEILEVKRDSVSRLVRKLAEDNLIEYRPPFRGTEIRVLKRVKPRELTIDEKALKEKLRQAFKKLDKIEEYVYNFNCRQKYILDYFGDIYSKECGKCDSCLVVGERRPRKGTSGDYRPRKKSKVENIEVKEPKKNLPLSTKLTQLETLELFNKGKTIEKIAEERELTPGTIVNHLCFLIEKGLIKDIERLVRPKIQNKIKDYIKETAGEKLKEIKEGLGDEISYDEIKLTRSFIKTKKGK